MPDSSTGARSWLDRATVIDMLLIATLWCVSLLIVQPVGDFPLNDDWSYGLTVKHFLDTGDFRPEGWSGMPLLSNVLWGSIFSVPFGFSFTALRVSTLLLSLVGVLTVYALARERLQPRWLAFTISLIFAFNPAYYALSNTFMTDVPYTTMALLAILLLGRALRTESISYVLLGSLMVVVATLSRQVGVSIALAFALTFLLTRRFSVRNLIIAGVPAVLSFGALIGFQRWLQVTGRLPALYNVKTDRLFEVLSAPPKTLLLSLVTNANITVIYLGLFLFPALLLLAVPAFRLDKRQVIAVLVIALLGLGVLNGVRIAYDGNALLPLPSSGNVIVRSGIGPLTLRDALILHLDHMPALSQFFWTIATLIGFFGGGLLIALVVWSAVNFIRRRPWAGAPAGKDLLGAFLLLSGVIYLSPLIISGFFDRYLVPALPLFAIGLGGAYEQFSKSHSWRTRILRWSAVGLLSLYALFAIAGVRDYLAWNRVRWDALHALLKDDHVDVKQIDGGFEFNGLYLYDPDYRKESGKSWWWVGEDTYQLGFGPLPGYHIIKEKPYWNWMPPHEGKVFVLQEDSR